MRKKAAGGQQLLLVSCSDHFDIKLCFKKFRVLVLRIWKRRSRKNHDPFYSSHLCYYCRFAFVILFMFIHFTESLKWNLANLIYFSIRSHFSVIPAGFCFVNASRHNMILFVWKHVYLWPILTDTEFSFDVRMKHINLITLVAKAVVVGFLCLWSNVYIEIASSKRWSTMYYQAVERREEKLRKKMCQCEQHQRGWCGANNRTVCVNVLSASNMID